MDPLPPPGLVVRLSKTEWSGFRRPAKRACTSGETESAPICSPVDVPEDKVEREEGWTSPAFTATSLVVSRAPIAADEFENTFVSERSGTSGGRPNGPAPEASTGETGGRPNGSAPPVEVSETGAASAPVAPTARRSEPCLPLPFRDVGGRSNEPAPPSCGCDADSSVAPPAVRGPSAAAASETPRTSPLRGGGPESPGVGSSVQGQG